MQQAYCDTQDVKAYYLGKDFKFEDYITHSEVETFISQEAAYIDAVIAVKYTLPITHSSDLMLLKMINEKLVVGTIDEIFREKEKGQAGEFDRPRNPRKEAKEWLKMISEGTMVLSTSQGESPIKYNALDSRGETPNKPFTVADFEAPATFIDRDRKTIERIG